MQQPIIETQADYYVPLLRILADLPKGAATAQEVVARFLDRYGNYIAAEHREHLSSNPDIAKWESNIHWARNKLRMLGFLDTSHRGIWKLSDAGRRWLEENPEALLLEQANKSRRGPRAANPARTSHAEPTQPPPGVSLEMLEQTKQVMGEDVFRQVWGALYDQLVAAERAKAITSVSDRDLLQAARQQVRQIQDYLQGHNGNRPSSEQLCDWIHFCYQFSLYREAAALFTLVNPDDVNPWYLERTRKIAAASRSRR